MLTDKRNKTQKYIMSLVPSPEENLHLCSDFLS